MEKGEKVWDRTREKIGAAGGSKVTRKERE